MNRTLRVLTLFLLPLYVFAQHTVSGTVTDAGTGDALAGANVVVEGTSMGAAANLDGVFTISNVPAGTYSIAASVIGYADISKSVNVSGDVTVNFALETSAVELSALEVLASRAGEKTPVAYTNISKEEMEVRLGSQDIPMILNTTPSVYATQQGGGAGDARINVRGFNQRNVAVMINGVPQNDMENGWVYWSNWDGVGDATSSIQMQRGLSAVNLATPSIGGTMNIITDPTAMERGGKFKQEVGDGGFLKSTINYNTGLIGDKLALSGTIVRKTGDGIIDGNWTDAWAYYFGVSYALNEKNRLELYGIGAPQRHGQNLYKQNAGVYDQDFAKDMDGYDAEALDKFGKPNPDHTSDPRLFNQNWAPVSSSYKGKQYFYMYGANTVDRYDPNFINERENFFHKPLINLNHFLTINDRTRLSSIFYWSGGSGGGTGTYGRIPTMDAAGKTGGEDWKFYYGNSPWTRNWDALIAMNSGTDTEVYVDKRKITRSVGESVGILRNSINRQWTVGAISKLNYDLSDNVELQFGIDWRTAGIEHAREVRDLMGGDFYISYADKNHPDGISRGLGDIIAYHSETTVDWIGFFGQGSYASGPISAYGMAGYSTIKYSYQDHFTVADEVIKADGIGAIQFKGGVMYDVNENISVFGNFGIVEKPPIMDNVIYYDGTVAADPVNESFMSTEFGLNFRKDRMAAKVNFYNTQWMDRNLTKAVTTGQGSSGDTDVIFLTGVDQSHSGIEFEGSYQVMDMLRLDAAASFGDWYFAGDAKGDYQEQTATGIVTTKYEYALKNLKIGDMPQTGIVLGATVTPITGLSIQGIVNVYDNNYADWSPDAREIDEGDDPDREQVWTAPGYNKMDLHVYYNLPISLGNTKLSVFMHVFNVLDEVFVQDAVDNSQYNAWDKDHDADSAEIFLGTPRYINAGINVRF